MEMIKTKDRAAAADFVLRHLESAKSVNAQMQKNLDGEYTVEVSWPTDDCADNLKEN